MPRLPHGAGGAGDYRIDTEPLPNGRKITHADLATALLEALTREDLHHKLVYGGPTDGSTNSQLYANWRRGFEEAYGSDEPGAPRSILLDGSIDW